ncbi:WD repeats-containing protein [Cryptosporidium ubiquitum]|uniref:WD repeats-containing protein n=1 Tax=Cryptosporidium ubiquitum TaxID=857276 RepID=A0A1J4MDF2_9CRYT|nr:WD repeats-containing protein [Cryptosporidium ubiquitum]OII72274.1 WD repeats-containing protein [Cryptosporidium ubiquitum]
MNLGSKYENFEIPRSISTLFERKKVTNNKQVGALDLVLFNNKGIHPVLRRNHFETGSLYKKKSYQKVVTPILLNNVSLNNRKDTSMITSISSHKGLLAISNTRGAVGIYNINEMLKYRDLNNGKGPELKFPLGYVLTENEKRKIKRGRSFKLEPVHYLNPGENENHRGVVSSINLSPYDGQLFVTTGWDGNLKIWDTFEGSCALTLRSSSKINYSLISQKNPNILSLAIQNGTVGIVDLRIGEFSQTLFLDKKTTNLKLDRPDSPVLSVAWRTDSEDILATTSQNGFIRLWDLRFAPQPFLYMNSNLTDWEFVQETNSMTPLLLRQQMIQEGVEDFQSQQISQERRHKQNKEQGREQELNEDEKKFLKVIKESTNESKISKKSSSDFLSFYQSHFGISAPRTIGYAHESGVGFCQFLKNGRFLISSAQDGTIKLWNALNGKNCYVSYDSFESQAFWEGDGLVELGIDDQIQKYFKRFSLDSKDQDTLFHPNGNDIGIWNVRTGKCLKRLSAHINAKSVSIIHLNCYSNLMFSGDQSGYLHMWNANY